MKTICSHHMSQRLNVSDVSLRIMDEAWRTPTQVHMERWKRNGRRPYIQQCATCRFGGFWATMSLETALRWIPE